MKRHSSVGSVLRRFDEELRSDKQKKSRLARVEELLMRQAKT
ncbi:MAG: hypothetical protein V1861_03950 [Candidatus Micrarchaeota archaeon]